MCCADPGVVPDKAAFGEQLALVASVFQLEAEAFGALSCTQLANQLAQRSIGGDSSVSRDPESTACSIFNSYLRSDFKQKAVRAY